MNRADRRTSSSRGSRSRIYEVEDLRAELLRLRKGVGFTEGRLRRCYALVAALGGADEPLTVLVERYESAIDSLRDEDATLLRGVFAFTPDTEGVLLLGDRRKLLGEQLGITPAAVADRDAAAIERLLRQIESGWYPKSPIPAPLAGVHSGIVYHSAHLTTLVRDGLHIESRHHYRLYCAYDGARSIEWNNGSADRVLVTGDFRLETHAIAGGYRHEFWHVTPMQRGHVYELRFIVRPPEDDRGWLTENSLAFHTPVRHVRFETIFMGQRPRIIWQFSGLTHLERPGMPHRDRLLDLADSSSATAEFHDLHGGLFAGTAWRWDWE